MKLFKKVLLIGLLCILLGCSSTRKLVYTVNGTTVIGTWVEK